MLAVTDFTDDNFLLMLTDDGLIKKTPLSRLLKLRATGLSVVKLEVHLYCAHIQDNGRQEAPAAKCLWLASKRFYHIRNCFSALAIDKQ